MPPPSASKSLPASKGVAVIAQAPPSAIASALESASWSATSAAWLSTLPSIAEMPISEPDEHADAIAPHGAAPRTIAPIARAMRSLSRRRDNL